jgi:hypothetical protein
MLNEIITIYAITDDLLKAMLINLIPLPIFGNWRRSLLVANSAFSTPLYWVWNYEGCLEY